MSRILLTPARTRYQAMVALGGFTPHDIEEAAQAVTEEAEKQKEFYADIAVNGLLYFDEVLFPKDETPRVLDTELLAPCQMLPKLKELNGGAVPSLRWLLEAPDQDILSLIENFSFNHKAAGATTNLDKRSFLITSLAIPNHLIPTPLSSPPAHKTRAKSAPDLRGS